MTAAFLKELAEGGIRVVTDGTALKVKYTNAERYGLAKDEIRQRKAEIIAFLTSVKEPSEAYREQIRAGWNDWLHLLKQTYIMQDGMADADAEETAREVLTVICQGNIEAGNRHGIKDITGMINAEVSNATS